MRNNIKPEVKPVPHHAPCCSRRQKVWGVVALVGLFACGWMVGISINGRHHRGMPNALAVELSEYDCNQLQGKIRTIARGGSSECTGRECNAMLRDMNAMYAANCAERAAQPAAATSDETKDMETCALIEQMLMERIQPEDIQDSWVHEENIAIYTRLFNVGCVKNRDKYAALIEREQAILYALTAEQAVRADNVRTCTKIEQEVSGTLCNGCNNADGHIQNAKVYANLSERGCPENADKYVALAKQELELARALQDDDFSDSDAQEISATYKRIKMQNAADEIINKVQKLTGPAIDFIIQAGSIISE